MRLRAPLLFITVLIIATSGLIYELIAGTVASYVLGDSVTQFSTTIGTYLFAMGVGAYLSKFVDKAAERFIEIEIAAALLGGFSAPFLFYCFAHAEFFHIVLYSTIIAVGTLVGLEIPLLMRILREELEFKDLIAKVLTFDYLGALAGSLLFALILVPKLGLNRASLMTGLFNAAVAFGSTFVLKDLISRRARLRLQFKAVLLSAMLATGMVYAERMTLWGEQAFYGDPIIYAQQTSYQRIVLTRAPKSVQLFLNGNLQFSSRDEYRYHESLVHPAFAAAPKRQRVLVLGGGDGLAVREILRYPEVEQVTLVELDPGMTKMASTLPVMRDLTNDALADPKVETIHQDAFVWLSERDRNAQPFDVVIVDFPDPNNFSLGKLYTRRFYGLLRGAMHDDTAVAVQSTSPLFARRSFWCIVETMASAGLTVHPYHTNVPSFGEWGYVLAMPRPFDPPVRVPLSGLRYLTDQTMASQFVFSEDMGPVEVQPNRLSDQTLVQYYESEWEAF